MREFWKMKFPESTIAEEHFIGDISYSEKSLKYWNNQLKNTEDTKDFNRKEECFILVVQFLVLCFPN